MHMHIAHTARNSLSHPITINGNVIKVGFAITHIIYLCVVWVVWVYVCVVWIRSVNQLTEWILSSNKWPICLYHQRLSVCQALSRSLNILNIYYFYDSSGACVCVYGFSGTAHVRRTAYTVHILCTYGLACGVFAPTDECVSVEKWMPFKHWGEKSRFCCLIVSNHLML